MTDSISIADFSRPVTTKTMSSEPNFLAWFHAACFVDGLSLEPECAVREFSSSDQAGIVFG